MHEEETATIGCWCLCYWRTNIGCEDAIGGLREAGTTSWLHHRHFEMFTKKLVSKKLSLSLKKSLTRTNFGLNRSLNIFRYIGLKSFGHKEVLDSSHNALENGEAVKRSRQDLYLKVNFHFLG